MIIRNRGDQGCDPLAEVVSGVVERTAGVTAALFFSIARDATGRSDGALYVQVEITELADGPRRNVARLGDPFVRKLLLQGEIPGLNVAAFHAASGGCQIHVRRDGNLAARK